MRRLRWGTFLFPVLLLLIGLSMVVAAGKAIIDEWRHWWPEFAITWRYLQSLDN